MTTATAKSSRTDIYTRVTSHIIEELERGTRPWLKPWNAEHLAGRITRPLRHHGQCYRGINIVMLWMEAEFKGYASPFWLTYQQAMELGGHVRKSEHGTPVVYASRFTKTETADDGTKTEQEIPFLKEYTMFNAEQCEGLPAYFTQLAAAATTKPPARIEQAERFFASTKATIRHGGSQAYYAIGGDYIQMPPFETFRDAESHAATLAHELTHWTRHSSRLNRDFGRKQWGDEAYAVEELVAELGSAFLCADLAITPEVRDDHAAYIASWLNVLKGDKRAIFAAASHATKAVDFLHDVQPKATA
jgi:antirestriction protein ArdC